MALTFPSLARSRSRTTGAFDAVLPASGAAIPSDALTAPRWGVLVQLADTAAGIIEAPFAGRGSRRRWIVREAGPDFEVLRVVRGKVETLGPLGAAGSSDTASWRRDLAGADTIELRLHADKVIRQRLSLPGESRGFLAPIIEHRLDRLTPWKSENVAYGFDTAPGSEGATGIAVEFAATSRDIVKDALTRLAALGIVPTAIGSDADPLERPVAVDLLRGGGNSRQIGRRRALRRACLVVLPLTLAAFLFNLYAVSQAEGDLDAVSAQLDAQRRAIQSRMSDADPRQAALALIEAKRIDTATFQRIDQLAVVVPDGTFLTDMEILATSLRIKGRSGNAPALIPLLEAEAGLKDVRFEAPVIREADGGDRFDIVATIEGTGGGIAQP